MMSQANTYLLQMPEPYGFGKTILQSGLLMTPMALVMLIVAPLAGKFMPKIGAKPIGITGALIGSGSLALMSLYATEMSLWQFVTMMVIVGVGINLMNISLINVLVFSVPPRMMGVATGSNSLFRNFGSTRGPAIAGTVMITYYVLFHPPGVPAFVQIRIATEKAFEVLFGGACSLPPVNLPFISGFHIRRLIGGGFFNPPAHEREDGDEDEHRGK